MNVVALPLNYCIPTSLLPDPVPLFQTLISIYWNWDTKTLYLLDWVGSNSEKKVEECTLLIIRNRNYLVNDLIEIPTAEMTYPLHVHISEENYNLWLGTTKSVRWCLEKLEVCCEHRQMVSRLIRNSMTISTDRAGRFHLHHAGIETSSSHKSVLTFSKPGRILPTLVATNRLMAVVKTQTDELYHQQWELYYGFQGLPDCLSFRLCSWTVFQEVEEEEEEGTKQNSYTLTPIRKGFSFQRLHSPNYLWNLILGVDHWFLAEDTMLHIIHHHPFLVPRFSLLNFSYATTLSPFIPHLVLGSEIEGTPEEWANMDTKPSVGYWSDVVVDHQQQSLWLYSCQKQWLDEKEEKAIYQTTVIRYSLQMHESFYFPILFHHQPLVGFTSCYFWAKKSKRRRYRYVTPSFQLWLEKKDGQADKFLIRIDNPFKVVHD
jgi:hypothetical protein